MWMTPQHLCITTFESQRLLATVDHWACLPLCQTSKATKFFLSSSKRLLFHPEEFGTWRDPGIIFKSHLIYIPKKLTRNLKMMVLEEVPFWNHHFQVPLFVFGRVICLVTHEQRCPWELLVASSSLPMIHDSKYSKHLQTAPLQPTTSSPQKPRQASHACCARCNKCAFRSALTP